MKLTFAIASWDAWMPGIRGYSDWQLFLSSGRKTPTDEAFANIEYRYLKPAQRRRLSDISKITLDVAFAVTENRPGIRSIFASRRGEVGRMADLLHSICTDDDLSPTAFSMSVHNTASGLFSIQSGNKAPSTAIAAGHDTVVAGLIEACSLLAKGQKEVLLVVTEDQVPDVYRQFSSSGEQPVAAAFLLTAGNELTMELTTATTAGSLSGTSDQVMQIISPLITGKPGIIAGERMPCLIRRV